MNSLVKEKYKIFYFFLIYLLYIYFTTFYTKACFWEDELVSWWISSRSFYDSIFNTGYYPPHPIYYGLLNFIQAAFGSSELILRNISIFSAILTSFVIIQIYNKIVERPVLVNEKISLLILFLFNFGIFSISIQARPYMLGFLLSSISLFFILKYSNLNNLLYLILSSFFYFLTIFTHPFFLYNGLINILVFCIIKKQNITKIVKVFLFYALVVGIAYFLTKYFDYFKYVHDAKMYNTFQENAPLKRLFFESLPNIIIYFYSIYCLLQYNKKVNGSYFIFTNNLAKVMLACSCIFILPPLLIYSLSIIKDSNILIRRYYVYSTLGLIILANYTFYQTKNKLYFCMVIIFGLLYFISFKNIMPDHYNYRQAIKEIANQDKTSPLILYMATGKLDHENVNPDYLYGYSAAIHYYAKKFNFKNYEAKAFAPILDNKYKEEIFNKISSAVRDKRNIYLISTFSSDVDLLETIKEEVFSPNAYGLKKVKKYNYLIVKKYIEEL